MEANSLQISPGFKKADKIVVRIMRVFVWLSALALITIMVVAFANVCGEKLVKAGVTWASGVSNSNAIIQYFHIPLVFLAAGYVSLDQGHTRIDLLISKFPRVEKIAALVGHILGAAVSFFICYRGVAVTLVKDFQRVVLISNTVGAWKEWPFTVCHCVGFFLLGMSFIWSFVRMVVCWKAPGVNMTGYIYPKAPEEADDIAPEDPEDSATEEAADSAPENPEPEEKEVAEE